MKQRRTGRTPTLREMASCAFSALRLRFLLLLFLDFLAFFLSYLVALRRLHFRLVDVRLGFGGVRAPLISQTLLRLLVVFRLGLRLHLRLVDVRFLVCRIRAIARSVLRSLFLLGEGLGLVGALRLLDAFLG